MKHLLTFIAMLTPLTAMAGDDICTRLIPDITQNYYLDNLEVMPQGNSHVSQSLVSCTYKATTAELHGDNPVMVVVLLNTVTNRFVVEVH